MMKIKPWLKHKYTFVFILLSSILIIEFASYLKNEFFYRFKFDLDQTETVQNITETNAYNITYNSIKLKNNAQLKLEAYEHYVFNFSKEEKEFIFSFDDQQLKDDTLTLNNVLWFFTHPVKKEGVVKLKKVKLHREEKGSISVNMLTEQLGCCLIDGKRLRYFWNKDNIDLRFLGQNKDLYGYHYTGGENLKSKGLKELSENTEKADVYVIWTGRNEKDSQELIANLQQTIDFLKQKNQNSKILMLYPAPSPVAKLDKNIEKNVKAIQENHFEGITEINLYSLIKHEPNWETVYFKYDYALSEKAYQLIIKNLENAL